MISPEVLRRYPFFGAGGEAALTAIAMLAEEVAAPAGTVLFRDGDPADRVYVVLEGEIDIMLTLAAERDVVVDSLVGGDLLGWSALSRDPTRRATAVVRRAARLAAVDAAGLRALMQENAPLGRELLRAVVDVVAHRLAGAWVQLAAAQAG